MNPKATKVFLNGIVLTMNAANQVCEAIALQGDKILDVGKSADMKGYVSSKTEVVDLKGATLISGFYDSHSHISDVADSSQFVDLSAPPIGKIKNISKILEALQQWAKTLPADKWIMGYNYNDIWMEERRHPTRYDLDKVSKDRPILLVHISGHIVAVNSKALELCGITKDTPDPPDGRYRRDQQTGELLGIVEEMPGLQFLDMARATIGHTDTIQGFQYAGERYASQGVTTASDAFVNTEHIKNLVEAIRLGYLPIRVVVNLSQMLCKVMFPPEEKNNFDPARIKKMYSDVLSETDKISFGGIKLIQDGSIQGYTAYLSKPYYTPFQGNAGWSGYPLMPREEFSEWVSAIHKAGFQCVVHANGDAAIDDVLYSFEKVQKDFPRQDHRHVIIHCQTAREDQLNLMKKLGVVPSFFILHTYYWGDVHQNIFLGPERARRIDPLKSALDRGIIFTTHCDTPVTPQCPLMCVWASVNRITSSGKSLGPEQRISVLDALRNYTINAAYQNFEENIKGSLEKGKLADMAILDHNPLTCDPLLVKDIQVMETIVGGKTVYKK